MKQAATQAEAEKRIDCRLLAELPWHWRWPIRLFRRHVNRVASLALCRAYERGKINSVQLHEIAAIIDRMLWPVRHCKKRGGYYE